MVNHITNWISNQNYTTNNGGQDDYKFQLCQLIILLMKKLRIEDTRVFLGITNILKKM